MNPDAQAREAMFAAGQYKVKQTGLAQWQEDNAVDGLPHPCQPIGCDNGIHLRGCTYAAAEGDAAT